MNRATRSSAKAAASGFLFASAAEMQAVPTLHGTLAPTVAAPGVDVAEADATRPATRQAIGADGSSRVIVCVCDRHARVRAATALRTLALLAPRHPELHLALVGHGSDDEDLRMHAAALRLSHAVSHLGERDDHLAVLRAADVGWVAAGEDDGAFAALDFMAARVPVLAERGSVAQRYLADGITGALLPPGDAASTAAAVASILSHDTGRVAMGNAGRTRVARDFSAAAMADGFERAGIAARDRSRWIA